MFWSFTRKQECLGSSRESGSTLVEFVLAFSLAAIISSIALPNMVTMKYSFDRHNGKQQFELAVRRTRSEAVGEGVRGVLSITMDGSAYTFGKDYLPYNAPPQEDSVAFIRDFPNGITAVVPDKIVFDSRGYLINTAGGFSSTTFQLQHNGMLYCSGVISSTGTITYNC